MKGKKMRKGNTRKYKKRWSLRTADGVLDLAEHVANAVDAGVMRPDQAVQIRGIMGIPLKIAQLEYNYAKLGDSISRARNSRSGEASNIMQQAKPAFFDSQPSAKTLEKPEEGTGPEKKVKEF